MFQTTEVEAFWIMSKWRDDASILLFESIDGKTGKALEGWVQFSEVNLGKSPQARLSVLEDPFPNYRLILTGAEYEYGDYREFDEPRMAEMARTCMVCYLLVSVPAGADFVFFEVRRDLLPGVEAWA